jgi:predicted ATPase
LVQRHGVADHQGTGSEAVRPYYLGLLAEAYLVMAQPTEGLSVLSEALEIVNEVEVHLYGAELYRLRGELLLCQARARAGRQGLGSGGSLLARIEESVCFEAEACYRQALEIARGQRTRMLELRAAMSLSRLWKHSGRGHQARQLLAGIYGWFTEGFEMTDLQDARARLEELT